MLPVLWIDHFGRVRAGKDSLGPVHIPRLLADRDRHAIVMPDVGELLARSKNKKIKCQCVISETYNGRLRPSIGTHG